MRIYWKPIIIDLALEVLVGLNPSNSDVLVAMNQYLVESCWDASKTAVHLVLAMNNQPALFSGF